MDFHKNYKNDGQIRAGQVAYNGSAFETVICTGVNDLFVSYGKELTALRFATEWGIISIPRVEFAIQSLLGMGKEAAAGRNAIIAEALESCIGSKKHPEIDCFRFRDVTYNS